MRLSKLFTKTRKEPPRDEVSKNAILLIKAGYIHKEMSGVYSLLPLGLRVVGNIARIIREEMNAIGGQEVLMTTLQDSRVWKQSGRWDDRVVDNWFKTELKGGGEVGIANTHEEPIVLLLKEHVSSYKDLPLYIYQIQTKFRNELRAKSGIMRAREFQMKDLYSFNHSEEEFREFYETCANAYSRIFKRVGIGEHTYRTIAAGGSFTEGFTDEFQTVADAGEDVIYIDEKKGLAINKEVYTDENLKKFGFTKDTLIEQKAIEVGNIFPLGTKYSDALGLLYRDRQGEEKPVYMGSYGIGLGRLMGAVAEITGDSKGLRWPRALSPYDAHLVVLGEGARLQENADMLYRELAENGLEVLYDDRRVSAGVKFADAELIGIPYILIVSEKTLAQDGQIEIKKRESGESRIVAKSALFEELRRTSP